MIFLQGIVSSILVLLVGRGVLRSEVSWRSVAFLFLVYFVAQFVLQELFYGTDFHGSLRISLLIGCVSVVGAIAYFYVCQFRHK